MRLSKTVPLGPGRDAVVSELRVRDVRALLALLPAELPGELEPAAVVALLRTHLPEIITLAGDGVMLSDGGDVADLALSEVAAVGQAWWGLHAPFFTAMGGAAAAAETPAPTT